MLVKPPPKLGMHARRLMCHTCSRRTLLHLVFSPAVKQTKERSLCLECYHVPRIHSQVCKEICLPHGPRAKYAVSAYAVPGGISALVEVEMGSRAMSQRLPMDKCKSALRSSSSPELGSELFNPCLPTH